MLIASWTGRDLWDLLEQYSVSGVHQSGRQWIILREMTSQGKEIHQCFLWCSMVSCPGQLVISSRYLLLITTVDIGSLLSFVHGDKKLYSLSFAKCFIFLKLNYCHLTFSLFFSMHWNSRETRSVVSVF